MTTYIEAYENTRDHLIPGGWAMAGTGERYPGEFHGRALVAVRDLEAYIDRTWDFWKLEPAPDFEDVLGRYNSLWDALAYRRDEPEPAPESSAGPAPDSGGPSTDVDEAASLTEPADFHEADQPTEEIVAAFEAGDQGLTGEPASEVPRRIVLPPVSEPENPASILDTILLLPDESEES